MGQNRARECVALLPRERLGNRDARTLKLCLVVRGKREGLEGKALGENERLELQRSIRASCLLTMSRISGSRSQNYSIKETTASRLHFLRKTNLSKRSSTKMDEIMQRSARPLKNQHPKLRAIDKAIFTTGIEQETKP
jgi:hypothetical protein